MLRGRPSSHELNSIPEKAPAMQAANVNEPSKGPKELELILTKLRNSMLNLYVTSRIKANGALGVAASSSEEIPQDQSSYQDVQPHNHQAPQSLRPGRILPLQELVQSPEQPAGWTDVMTGWVRYLLQTGSDLEAIEVGMRSFFPVINSMVGVMQHLETIKTEWEDAGVPMRQD